MFKFRVGPIILLVVSFFMVGISVKYKAATELLYTNIINKAIRENISKIFDRVNFSISDILVVVFLLLIILFILNLIKNLFKPKKWVGYVIRVFWGSVNILSISLFIYLLFFGLNYHVPNLEKNLVEKYNNKYSTDIKISFDNEKVLEVYKYLAQEANNNKKLLQSTHSQNDTYNVRDISSQGAEGFRVVSDAFPVLSGNYSMPKETLAGNIYNFFGLDARYSILTNEITINKNIPKEYLPFLISKYMSYQRGIAKEDEAIFYAYVASINNTDIKYKYSAYLNMLYMVSEYMRENDKVSYNQNLSLIDEDVKRDLHKIDSYKENYGSGRIITDNTEKYFKRINGDVRVSTIEEQVTRLISAYYSLFTYN